MVIFGLLSYITPITPNGERIFLIFNPSSVFQLSVTLPTGSSKGIILPLGSTEQHGPTGAIGTDAITAEAIALAVSKQTGVLVTPTQSYGMAEHHLGFPGTMSLQPLTLLKVIHDLVLSLAKNGFERIFRDSIHLIGQKCLCIGASTGQEVQALMNLG